MTGEPKSPLDDLDLAAAMEQAAAFANDVSFWLMQISYAAAVVIATFDFTAGIVLGIVASWMRLSMMVAARVAKRLFVL